MKFLAACVMSLLMVNVGAGAARAERPLAEYVAFAQAVWHAPCDIITATYSPNPIPEQPAAIGASVAQECRISVRSGMTDAQTCAVVVHEVGHLAGAQHSEDPHDVMYHAMNMWPPCERRYGTIRDWTRTTLSLIGSQWRCSYIRRDDWAVAFSCRTRHQRMRVVVNFWGDLTTRNRSAPRG